MQMKKINSWTFRNFLNRLKIKQKLLFIYSVAFLLPMVIITVCLSSWFYGLLRNWRVEQAKTSIAHTSSLLLDMIRSAEELSDSLYINRAVQDTISRSFSTNQEVYDRYMELDFLDDFLHATTDVASFRYYTENQTLLDNSYFCKSTEDVKTSSWYKNARAAAGKITWQMKNDSITSDRMLTLTRAVFRKPDGKFLGVLVIYLSNEKIQKLLSKHENETFLCVNGRIEYASGELPDLRRPVLLNRNLEPDKTAISEGEWGGEKVLALMSALSNVRGSIVLAQVITQENMLEATSFGVLICAAIMLVGAMVSLFSILLFSGYFSRRVDYVKGEIKKVVQNKFELGPRLSGTDEFVEIYDSLETTANNIKTLIDEVYQHRINREKLLARQNDIRFKMLASQINPHFLFNTLETIRMQALADGNREVARTIKLLAKILRHNLDATDQPVPLVDEMEAVSNYLDIQHLRFADRVSYDIMFMCNVDGIGILPLLIQPLVENSFSHGLEERRPGGFICLTIDTDEDGSLLIRIRDNGCGMSEQKLEQLRSRLATGTVEKFTTSIGMVNVNQRIKLYYGEKYGLEIESRINEGTEVVMKIPRVPLTGKGEVEDV
ncbi:MAG: sensor histidine kinase [Treponema sp.]|nr:sensor histidine kinase [Treponema sp.]